jgi:ABC-type branched-subunit amino acid transport system substrate-binding protein
MRVGAPSPLRWRAARLAAAVALALPLLAGCSRSSGEPDIAGAAAEQHGQPEPAPGFDGTTIQVGLLVPASGPDAEIAAARAAGLKAYLDYVTFELGGIGGTYPIDLVVRDASDVAKARAAYDELSGSTVLLADVQGREIVAALLPSLRADGAVAGPAPASAAWAREPNLLQIGTPDELAAANALGWLLATGGGNADPAHLCRLVQTGADGDGWQRGLDLASAAAKVAFASTATVPAAPKATTGVQPQIDQLREAGCTSVLALAGAPTTATLLAAADASDLDARWVVPAASAAAVLASKDEAAQAFAADHLTVVDAGPTTTEPEGQAQLLRIRDGYAPGQPPSGAFLAGYLQGQAIVTILDAAVAKADLSRGGVLETVARFRSLPFDDLAPDAVLGPPERRAPQRASTVSRPEPGSPTLLEPIALGYEAPFTAAVLAQLLP